MRRGTWLALAAALALGYFKVPTVGIVAANVRLLLHLMNFLPRQSESKYGQRLPPVPRASNLTLPEVQGFLSGDEFRSTFLWKGPIVFRQGATRTFGFDPACLTKGGRTVFEGLEEEMGGTEVPIFKDQHDDSSLELMTIQRYRRLAEEATADSSKPIPYARAFPQKAMRKCQPSSNDRIKEYRSIFGWMFQEVMLRVSSMPDVSFLDVSFVKDSETKMHMDLGDSFFQQVYGRKKFLLADPGYASQLRTTGDTLNLAYMSGYDVFREPVPPEVPLRETVLHPGDLLYLPSMTFHAARNLDPVTVGVDNPAMDIGAGLARHWPLTLTTILNPWIPIQSAKIFYRTGTWDLAQLHFDAYASA